MRSGKAVSLSQLRADAIRRAFPAASTLKRAIAYFGFIQADPIRSPARAQDLILRHRVRDYRAGDLEQRYPDLDIEEDFLYAYGFLTRRNWKLLHPRVMAELSAFDRQVLQQVTVKGLVHPSELELELGNNRALNPWGGFSKATTRSLHSLHFRGLLRIARRDRGIRVYEIAPETGEVLESEERVRRLVILVCGILAPLPVRSLLEALRLVRYSIRGTVLPRSIVQTLLLSGDLEKAEVDGVPYVWPAASRFSAREPDAQVRLLSPFDPLVWDRRRFEHFWGWAYRFEAYTPEHKRVRGYYAMPLLWRDRIVGWANARVQKGQLHLDLGFQSQRPPERAFETALEEEAERLRDFLGAK